MNNGDRIIAIQTLLEIPEEKRFPRIGPLTRARFEYLATLDPEKNFLVAAVDEVREINADGLNLIKHFESLFLQAYKDPVGIWTIGWGHTGLQHNDGTVKQGRSITLTKAIELLNYDMNQFESRVSSLVDVPLNDNEFAALVSFDFNTGGLKDSTMLRLLNDGDRAGAANQFLRWVWGGGKILPGLVRRRRSERNLFLSIKPYIIT